jgi:hypothetical protein
MTLRGSTAVGLLCMALLGQPVQGETAETAPSAADAQQRPGQFGESPMRAWTLASDTGWHPAVPGRPRLALRADVTSGDRKRLVGQSPEVEIEKRLSRHLTITTNVARFSAGPFLQEIHVAAPTLYMTTLATYRF